MPSVPNFKHLGHFPFCIDSAGKTDVSGFDYWTTLSGVSKVSPTTTTALIEESLINARRLYWDTYGITGSASADFDDFAVSDYSYSETIANVSVDDQPDSFDPIPVPEGRVCSAPFIDTSKEGSYTGLVMRPYLIKLYNGPVTEEGNFVGYGMSIANVAASAVAALCRVRLNYYADDISLIYDYVDQSMGYVELYGMHFVAESTARSGLKDDGIEANITSSTSLSPLSASMTVIDLIGIGYQSDCSAEMTSLDFYTYT